MSGIEITIIIVVLSICSVALGTCLYKRREYNKKKDEVRAFVESYRKRCKGVNRFVVTVETLQDSFREHDTETIRRIWKDLVDEHVISVDPQDGEYCIRANQAQA